MLRRHLLAALVAATPSLTPRASAQSTPAWRADLGGDFKRMTLAVTGAVLVETKPGVAAISADSGTRLWSRPDAAELTPIDGTPLAAARVGGGWRLIDLTTGADRWDFAKLGLSDPVRFVPLPSCGVLLVYGPSTASPMTLLSVGLDSGVVRWRQDSLLDPSKRDAKPFALSQHVPPVVVGDSTVLLDADEGGLINVRLGDGAVRWRVAAKLVDLDKVSAPIQVIDGAVYIGLARERRLFAVDLATGALRWRSQRQFPGDVQRLGPSSAGVVVGGSFTHVGWSNELRVFIDLVDPGTGASRWPKPLEIRGQSPFLVRSDSIFQPVYRAFNTIDAVSGKVLIESGTPEFGGHEEPLMIEPQENGDLVLLARQDVMRVDPNGRVKYHRYLKAPGNSMLAKVAAITATVALSAVSYSNAGSMGGYYFVPTGISESALRGRYHATLNANRYTYIYTSEIEGGDGFDLVRLDKTDGAEKGRVRLTDRSPNYVIDPVSGTVLTVIGRELVAYRYPAP